MFSKFNANDYDDYLDGNPFADEDSEGDEDPATWPAPRFQPGDLVRCPDDIERRVLHHGADGVQVEGWNGLLDPDHLTLTCCAAPD